jgi:flagellar biosynthesis protein FliR
MVPQVNVFVEGMPLKILMTIVVLSFSLSATVTGIAHIFRSMDMDVLRLMRLMV